MLTARVPESVRKPHGRDSLGKAVMLLADSEHLVEEHKPLFLVFAKRNVVQ